MLQTERSRAWEKPVHCRHDCQSKELLDALTVPRRANRLCLVCLFSHPHEVGLHLTLKYCLVVLVVHKILDTILIRNDKHVAELGEHLLHEVCVAGAAL